MSTQKLAEIVMKIWTDPAYKSALLADPKKTLEFEGFAFPAGLQTVHVVQNTPDAAYFVIPAQPAQSPTISPADLEDKLQEILSVQLVLPTILGLNPRVE